MALFLTESQVNELITAADAVAVVEQSMQEIGNRTAINLPRQRLRLPQGMLHMLAAAQPEQGVFALKAYTAFKGKIRFRILLYDAANGDILALIEGDRLGQLRTGAATAVGTKYMANPNIERAGLFGTGFQAEGQLEALVHVCPLKEVLVYGRDAERRKSFCERMSTRLGIDVRPVESAAEAVRDLPLIITATTSKDPVFDGKLLAEGAHVNAVGANLLIKREIDGTTLKRSKPIVVDSIEQAKLESGALLQAVDAGRMHWGQVWELGDVMAGRVPGRNDTRDITLFHSLGLAVWDTATANFVYRKAMAQGVGTELPFN